MAAKPPFNMLRAAFWLLAALVGTELLVTLVAGASCVWGMVIVRTLPEGSCAPIREWAQELWAEILAAILALLLASNSSNGRPPPPPPSTDQR